MAGPLFLTLAEAIKIHADQLAHYGGQVGVRDFSLLESALAQPEASFAGEWLHKDLYEMASAYAYHVSQNHPFIDGNKRTALACALVFLRINNVGIRGEKKQLKDAMLQIASGTMRKAEFAQLLRKLFPDHADET